MTSEFGVPCYWCSKPGLKSRFLNPGSKERIIRELAQNKILVLEIDNESFCLAFHPEDHPKLEEQFFEDSHYPVMYQMNPNLARNDQFRRQPSTDGQVLDPKSMNSAKSTDRWPLESVLLIAPIRITFVENDVIVSHRWPSCGGDEVLEPQLSAAERVDILEALNDVSLNFLSLPERINRPGQGRKLGDKFEFTNRITQSITTVKQRGESVTQESVIAVLEHEDTRSFRRKLKRFGLDWNEMVKGHN